MKILAVCKGNRARSPMFEAILGDSVSSKGHTIESAAGLQEADGMEPEEGAVIALRNIGLNISGHRARWIGRLDLSGYDKIYCMDPGVVPIVERQLGPLAHSSNSVVRLVNAPDGVPNPYGKNQAAYDQALMVVSSEVDRILEEEL